MNCHEGYLLSFFLFFVFIVTFIFISFFELDVSHDVCHILNKKWSWVEGKGVEVSKVNFPSFERCLIVMIGLFERKRLNDSKV